MGSPESRDIFVEFQSVQSFRTRPREVTATWSYRFWGEDVVEETSTFVPPFSGPNINQTYLVRALQESGFLFGQVDRGLEIDRMERVEVREYRNGTITHTVLYYAHNREKPDGTLLNYECTQDMWARSRN